MYYYVENGDVVEKYLVEYDKEALEELRLEIIEKCSKIEHREHYCEKGNLDQIDHVRYRNLRIDGNSRKSEDFLYYDEYVYPPLVCHIDNLLAGKYIEATIFEILNETDIQEKKSIDSIDEDIKTLTKKMCETKLSHEDELDCLRKLQEMVNYKRLNKNQISEREYYPKVQALLTMTLVDTMDFEMLIKSQKFLEETIAVATIISSDNLQKIKKMQPNKGE